MVSEENCGTERRWYWAAIVVAIVLMVVLRGVALDSDAYPRLSWSSALLTDEGFYLHNARNRVLFGHPQTDQFNNALIMPLLDALQTGVFHTFGVGAVQARAISVALGLLTLPVFCDALRRAFGLRTACLGTLLLGLDHVSLLYSRLGLMDTPAAFVLVCAFWLWVRSGESEGGRRGRRWLLLCGAALGLCYGVRGLGALVYPVPLLLLGREIWQGRRGGQGEARGFGGIACLLGGLALTLGLYGLLWAMPHRAELARVNHYYLFDQLIPHSLNAFLNNWRIGLFGDHRGLMPYLFRHDPIQTLLVLIWLVSRMAAASTGKAEPNVEKLRATNTDFLAFWLLIMWVLLCSIGYAPSRYYVLFLPAFAGLTGLTLSDVYSLRNTFERQGRWAAPVAGLAGFHVAQSLLHHLGIPGVQMPGIVGGVCVALAWHFIPRSRLEASRRSAAIWSPVIALVLWGCVNCYWTGDWLLNLTYRQRDADRWLAENLPANSVLIGAVAPGLSMNSHFVCVNVIEKLCNDDKPIEKFAPAPRYVLILDDRWREAWWQRNYPGLIAPQHRMHAFRGLLRPFFVIGLYRVPDGTGKEP